MTRLRWFRRITGRILGLRVVRHCVASRESNIFRVKQTARLPSRFGLSRQRLLRKKNKEQQHKAAGTKSSGPCCWIKFSWVVGAGCRRSQELPLQDLWGCWRLLRLSSSGFRLPDDSEKMDFASFPGGHLLP